VILISVRQMDFFNTNTNVHTLLVQFNKQQKLAFETVKKNDTIFEKNESL